MKTKKYKFSTLSSIDFIKLFGGTLITLGVITVILIVLSRLI